MGRMLRRILLTLVALTCISATAFAQEGAKAPTLPDPLTPEAVDALVSRLSDTEVRELLLTELGQRAAATPAPVAATSGKSVNEFTKWLGVTTKTVMQAIINSPEKGSTHVLGSIYDYVDSLGSSGIAKLVASILAALALGWGLDKLYARRIAAIQAERGVVTADAASIPPFPGSVAVVARRLLRDIGGAIIAFVAAAIFLSVLLPERETRIALAIVIWLIFIPRLVRELLRFFLSPHRPDLRLVNLDDRTAKFLTRWLVGITVVFGISETLMRIAEEIKGPAIVQGSGFWLSTIVYALLVLVVILARDGLRQLVRSGGDAMPRRDNFVVRFYPLFAVLAIIGTWAAGTYTWAMSGSETGHQTRHLIGLILLLVAPMCDALIRAAVHMVVPPPPGKGPVAEAAHTATIAGSIRIARVVVLGSLVLAIAALWRIPLAGFASAGLGDAFAVRAFGAVLILLVGYILNELIGLLVNRRLARESGSELELEPSESEAETGPTGGSAHSRLGTILPPVGLTARIAVGVMTVFMALSHMGVNIAPLLAGAGVLGIAIGFGAQKLVADVVSGVFFLIEDAFRTNEYISAGGIEGTVERISIRSLHLRQSDGALHCIPYSNVSQVTNFGRDWGTMKQVFTVPFDTSIDKVRKIFKKIGADLAANPEYKDAFIQPFKFKGVSQVNDIGIVVRGKFMFKPEMAKQFLINREIYKRVQADFAAAGIPFARREVHVVMDGKASPEEAARAAATAAAASG